jgi:hypothetical protein
MKVPEKQREIIVAVAEFLGRDLLQEQRQLLPNELQEIFDAVLCTDAGNCIELRKNMVRIKAMTDEFAKVMQPYTEEELQETLEFIKTDCQ